MSQSKTSKKNRTTKMTAIEAPAKEQVATMTTTKRPRKQKSTKQTTTTPVVAEVSKTATLSNSTPKKRGRKRENLIGKTMGAWKVVSEVTKGNDTIFICDHIQHEGMRNQVTRQALMASRFYTKRSALFNYARNLTRK